MLITCHTDDESACAHVEQTSIGSGIAVYVHHHTRVQLRNRAPGRVGGCTPGTNTDMAI